MLARQLVLEPDLSLVYTFSKWSGESSRLTQPAGELRSIFVHKLFPLGVAASSDDV